MAELKVGDRVSHKRRGCVRTCGTVAEVLDRRDDAECGWVLVQWDHGPACLWLADRLKAEKAKAR